MSNPFTPQEPHEVLILEREANASIYLGGVAYGIHISCFFMTIYYILRARSDYRYRQLIFVGSLFALGTVNIWLNMRAGQSTWIDYRNYPGGPPGFLQHQQGGATEAVGNAVGILISLLADGLLIYRCYALYRIAWMLVVPILAWLASFVLGILLAVQSSHPGSGLYSKETHDFSVPYFSLTMSLNILLTVLLIGRLMYAGLRLKKTLGKDHVAPYTAITVMLVESALPYGLVSLVFLGFYASGNPASILFVPLLVQVECIAPMVIVLRVAAGKAWSKETIVESLRFASMHGSSEDTIEENLSSEKSHVVNNRGQITV